MRGLRFFAWVIVPVAAIGIHHMFGLPHFIWSYAWQNNGTYNPFANRFYTRCTFIGTYGEFTIHRPANGKCSWVIFRKAQSVQSKRLSS